ncbi:retrovirus-related pol polyprotein from transposon TNT 1-94 [Tanacetum coccineum]
MLSFVILRKKNEDFVDTCNKCLELEAEFVKKNNAYNKLSKRFLNMEQHCISLEVAMQLNKEIFQEDKSSDNQNNPEIQEYFEQNDLKAQLQAKDTVISKLKEKIHSLRENVNPAKLKRVYYVEGLGHNLFSVGQFYDSKLKVAFHKHTCFVRNLKGVDLLIGSRGTNLYTLSIGDMMKSSPIYLLSKASKTKSWLWHRCLSHLNFGTINQLAKQGLVRGLPKMKFERSLVFCVFVGKSKKQSHKPKFKDTNQEKLYLLHIDLCGPMCVESINGKKYILVIINDYSQFTWVKFLRSKDEALEFILNFLKMIQVRLNATIRNIHTYNGT